MGMHTVHADESSTLSSQARVNVDGLFPTLRDPPIAGALALSLFHSFSSRILFSEIRLDM